MHGRLFNRIAILGLGLIGGSLARAAHERKLAGHIAAFDVSPATLEWAREKGIVDSIHATATEAVQDSDIIIFAAPPSAFAGLMQEIGPAIKPGAIVTDAASVKRRAIAALTEHLPAQAYYVPAHPIAGSEKTGVEASRADIFSGKKVILTPEKHQLMSPPVTRIRALWEGAGARIEYMPAELHDRIYASVSHLPQLVAFAAQSGRLAQSSPALWADICLANADYIDEALEEFLTFATQIAGELSQGEQNGAEDTSAAAALFPALIAVCLIAAASLLEEKTGINPARYAGAGFTEMTTPAHGDPQSVLLAVSEHSHVAAMMLGSVLARLSRIRSAIGEGDKHKLIGVLRS